MKKYFALKLIPNRPSFSQDMTDAERAIMLQHIAYWRGHMSNGFVLVFGPVLDPAGTYGLGIVVVDTEDQVKEFIDNDPASQINRYEYFPMMAVVPEK
jgi:uncharacterized protein